MLQSRNVTDMNERIKQLAEQVDKEFNSPYDRHKAIERFAELIVRDVVTTVKRTQVTSPDFEWAILNNYDFGVEE